MKFEIETKILENSLKSINNLISNSNNISPALSGVYIKTTDNSLTLIATNGDISYQQVINNIKVEKPTNFLVKAKILHDYLSKIRSEKVTIQQIDEKLLQLTIPKSCFEINLMDDSSFPILDFGSDAEKTIQISLNELITISEKIKPFTSIYSFNQTSPTTRMYLSSFDTNTIECVSSDGFRMAYYKFNYQGDDVKFTIEPKAIEMAIQILTTNKKDKIDICLSNKSYLVKCDETIIKFPLFTEPYPNIINVILNEQKNKFTINLKDLIDATNRGSIALTSEKKPIATFRLDNKKLNIKFISSEIANSFEEIDVEDSNIDTFEFKLNLKYFIPLINTIDGDKITFSFNGVNTPLILSTSNSNLLDLILPIKTI